MPPGALGPSLRHSTSRALATARRMEMSQVLMISSVAPVTKVAPAPEAARLRASSAVGKRYVSVPSAASISTWSWNSEGISGLV